MAFSSFSAITTPPPFSEQDIAEFIEYACRLERTVQSVVIGQDEVIRQTLIALLAGGHVLLEGVPGLGKTLLVRTVSAALDLSFSRVQFTPDLMPADITGTTILREDEHGRRVFTFQPGPLFAHMVLADEINRATPKTQSALLEGMQEGTVTVGNETHRLPLPFFVLATQNPLELEGTYPLPEAQLDRFMLKVLFPYPTSDVLHAIVRQTIHPRSAVEPVLDAVRLSGMIQLAHAVPIAHSVLTYAVSLVLASLPAQSALKPVQQFVRAGVSPRGLQALVACAQVRALFEGRYNVAIEDIQALAPGAMRHRILLNFEGEAEGLTTDALVATMLNEVPVP